MKTNKMWKRIVSLVMAICMISGMCVIGVFAEEETETLKAIKVEIDWNDTVSTNMVISRMGLTSMSGKAINAGDTLSYQVYIPSDGNYVYGMGAFDGQSGDFAAIGYWFPTFQDGAGMNNYGQLDEQGTDCWITREYTFDTTASFWHLGPAVITSGNHQEMAGKVSTVYYRNIVIKRADGTVDACYTDDAATGGVYTVEEYPNNECTFSITEGNYAFKKAATEEPPAEEAPAAPVAPAEVAGTIEFAMAFNNTYDTELPAAAYNWYGFGTNGGSYSNITLNAGDKLSYKVYIPSGSAYVPGMAVIDLQETAAWGVLSWTAGVTDQNGNPYYSDLATLYGRDKWIELTYELPENLTQGGGIQHIGPRNNFGPDVLESLKGQTAYFYFTDVKIVHADGTADTIVPDQTKLYNVNAADDFIIPYATVTNRLVPEAIGEALKFEMQMPETFTDAPTSGNVFNWYGFGSTYATYGSVTLAAGDKLSYKIYIPSDGNYVPGLGIVDLQENKGWGVLSWQPGMVDQNGNSQTCDLVSIYGADKWIELVYAVPDNLAGGGLQHIGPRNNFGAQYLEQLKGRNVYYYLDDVKIIHADSTETAIYPTQTSIYNVNADEGYLSSYVTMTAQEFSDKEPEPISGAVKISLDFGSNFENVPTEGNVYNWFGFGAEGGAYAGLTLAEGDKLAYKIYIPHDGNYVPGLGVVDLQETAAWGVLSWQPNIKDQNGNGQYIDLAETYGTNCWIDLVYEIPANLTGGGVQHIGPRNDFGAQYLTELEGKTAYYYLTDVKLIHADGTETAITPPETRIYNTNASDPLCTYATVAAEYLAEDADLSGVSMALGDDLAVKFHVKLDAAVAAAAMMKITVGNDAPITVKASDVQRDTDGNYIFVAHAAAAQMNDTIVLEQIYEGQTTLISSYSVCKYAAGVLKDASMSDYHELVKQMLNYGAMAQAYFDYNADAPANDGITVTLADVPQSIEEGLVISGAADGISFYGATAVFRSKTAVRYYFNVTGDINSYTFTVGDTAYEPVAKNDMYYIEVPGVNPQQIDETVTLNVTDGTDTLSVTYSPLCYIVRMYNGNGSETLKSLLKALYSYYLEAEAVTSKKRLMPAIVDDGAGGVSFGANGSQYVLWGVETDQWQAAAGNTAHLDAYIEASKYINANCLAIHAPWRLIEPQKDVYDFSYLEYALAQTEKAGLKAVIYFTAANYAAGNMQFVPDYINDPVTYSRIQGDPTYFRTKPVAGQPALPACPSDPNLLERELKAYGRLLKFLKEYDTNRNVLAIQVAGEADFLYAMKDEYWKYKNEDVRCECEDCNRAFAGFSGTNLEFMTQQFAVYIKTMVEAGAMVYDIPVYTCSSPLGYWKGEWRYAENSALRQEMVDFVDYFVGPTTAQTTDVQTYVTEMNNWTSEKMPGNHIWTSGIDTGHGTPGSPQENVGLDSWSHLEMAPWFNILHYKSLGAIYWDHPDVSVTLEDEGAPVREKLRAMWSPLRAASAILAAYKSAPADEMMWWHYEETAKSGTVGGFRVAISQNAADNYGFVLGLGEQDLILTATTYNSGTTTFTVEVDSNVENLCFQRGYFDSNGNWVATEVFTPAVEGNTVTFQISGDNGDYTKALYRIMIASDEGEQPT